MGNNISTLLPYLNDKVSPWNYDANFREESNNYIIVNDIESYNKEISKKSKKVKKSKNNEISVPHQIYMNKRVLAFTLSYKQRNSKMKGLVFSNILINKLTNSVITLNPYIHIYIGQLIASNNINNFIKKRIFNSTDSTESNSFFSDNYIVKVPQKSDYKYDSIPHEAIVGIGCLNEVRKYVPNFAYTYSYGMATLPLDDKIMIDKDKNVLSWNINDKNSCMRSYIVMENVVNSIELYEFINNDNINYKDIVICYLQLFNALRVAYDMFNYIHCDLHPDNILVRKFSEPVRVPIRNGEIYTKYVPYIIDYGRNIVLYDREKYKNPNLIKINKGNWGYDFTLLTYFSCSSNRKDVIKFLDSIWNFVYENKQPSASCYYDLEYLSPTGENDFQDFIVFNELSDKYKKPYIDIINYIIETNEIKLNDATGIPYIKMKTFLEAIS